MERKIAPDPVAEAMKGASASYDKLKNTLENSAYAEISLSNGTTMQKFPRISWDETYRKLLTEEIYEALLEESKVIDARKGIIMI